MKTEFIANNRKFSLQVVKGDLEQPGYVNQSEGISQVCFIIIFGGGAGPGH